MMSFFRGREDLRLVARAFWMLCLLLAMLTACVAVRAGAQDVPPFQANPKHESQVLPARVDPCHDILLDAGVNDNFSTANGSEPASPSAGLLVLMGPSPPPVGFDNTSTDRRFGHTFTVPPGFCITAARLEFRAKPLMSSVQPGSNNDAITLGFVNPGGQLVNARWTAYFGTGNSGLPILLAQQWISSNYPSGNAFVLDLGTLSGGVNLLPDLDANRFLDIYTQDDSSIDYLRLVVTLCDCPTSTPTSTATVTITPTRSFTPTNTRTSTRISTPTPTPTRTRTATPTLTPTNSFQIVSLPPCQTPGQVVDVDISTALNLTPGLPDPRWFVFAAPNQTGASQAYSTNPVSSWVTPTSTAHWIQRKPGGTPFSDDGGSYTFRLQIYIDPTLYSAIQIVGQYSADNTASQAGPPPSSCSGPSGNDCFKTWQSLNSTPVFVLGVNNLDVIVFNQSNVTGLVVEGRLQATCLIPTPTSTATVTITPTRSSSPTNTRTSTRILTPTRTATPTRTRTFTPSPTPTPTQTPTPLPCAQPPPGMVAWYPLDEQQGAFAVNDIAPPPSSVFNNVGTPQPGLVGPPDPSNGPAPVVGLVGAGALYFFTGNYVEVAPQAELDFGPGDFSIDAWVRAVGCGPGLFSPMVDKLDTGTSTGFSFYLDQTPTPPGNAFLKLQVNGSTFASTGVLTATANPLQNTGQWYHVAVTIQRTGTPAVGTFYIDGLPAGTFVPPAGTVTNMLPLWIGEIRVPGARCEIAIDELELFNRALTPQEVQSIFSPGSAGKCKAEICVMKFHDVDGNGVQDPGDPPLFGWTFEIEDNQGHLMGTVTTDREKLACLTVSPPGTYTVTEQVQSGWTPTTPNPQTVTLSPDQTASLSFGNRRSEGCDLAITKSIRPSPATSGQPVNITLTVTNVGAASCPPGPFPGTSVHDPRPTGLTFSPSVSIGQSGGSAAWQCSLSVPAGNFSCATPDPLPAGYTATFTFTATVTAPPGSSIQNCATTTNQNDVYPPNNDACATVGIRRCVGDCDASTEVTVNELITMVNIVLGNADVSTCVSGDPTGDDRITVDEIIKAVNNALDGCQLETAAESAAISHRTRLS